MSARSRCESGRILGKMIVDKLGGAGAKGTVIIGICFPGVPGAREPRQGRPGIAEGGAPASTWSGRSTSRSREVENYNKWEQLYAANPDAVAMIGLCAPDIASLGKLNAANGDKFVAGGYDLTEPNLKAIKDGHAFVTIGQSAFVQGYLPIALLVNSIKNEQAARGRLLRCRHADRDRRLGRHGQRPAGDQLRRGDRSSPPTRPRPPHTTSRGPRS